MTRTRCLCFPCDGQVDHKPSCTVVSVLVANATLVSNATCLLDAEVRVWPVYGRAEVETAQPQQRRLQTADRQGKQAWVRNYGASRDLSKGVSRDVSRDSSWGVSRDVSKGSSWGVSRDVSKSRSRGVSWGAPRAFQGESRGRTGRVAWGGYVEGRGRSWTDPR